MVTEDWTPPEIDFSGIEDTRSEAEEVLTAENEVQVIFPEQAYPDFLDEICRLFENYGGINDLLALQEINSLRADRTMPLSMQCEQALRIVRETLPTEEYQKLSDAYSRIQRKLSN